MSRPNINNERVKRKYIRWMKEAQGLSDLTINVIERAIGLYEDFTESEDFERFNGQSAVEFKKWLSQYPKRSRPTSVRTVYHYLRHLKRFLVWLSGQPGYRSRIRINDTSYLSLDRKSVREATAQSRPKWPPLEHVNQLAGSIDIVNEIDRRDQALISFLLLSGMRDTAVRSLPLGCFDPDTLQVQQDPGRGVSTKFGKSIVTTLFRFDDQLLGYVLNWVEFLKRHKRFSGACPMFPRSKLGHKDGGLSFISDEVEPVFWKSSGSIRQILKKRSVEADLAYFNPHSFRHAAVQLAMRRCRTPEEFKAVSQNLGHDNVGTTLTSYGKVDDSRVAELITSIDFSGSPQSIGKEQMKNKIRRMLEDL